MDNDVMQKWAKEIVKFLSIKPQYVLWGNVYDVYPVEKGGTVMTMRLVDYLRRLFTANGYALVVQYEPLYGFSLLDGSPDLFKDITGEKIEQGKQIKATLKRSAEIIEQLSSPDKAYTAVIMQFSSRIPDIAPSDMHEFYYRMFRLSHAAIPRMAENAPMPKHNVVAWVLDKENDIPDWYVLKNPRIKVLPIPRPDYVVRKVVIENLSRNMPGFQEIDEKRKKESVLLFIDQTSDLQASEIISIVSLAKRENIPFSEIGEAIRMYKLGIVENPWTRLDMDRIARADEILQVRVKGQPGALQKASDIIKRSVFNLSGAQYSKYSQRPKGVLFFAGPTGVGKTELAKAITELIFGTDTSCIRFDMSEFAQEHSDQRLVGAPPGYMGYDVGGQLTNAVRQNPFSVILFDEIEKAHPRILDIFLQILGDGRLTSGRGETAYFTESLIVFTSNLGITEVTEDGRKVQLVDPSMDHGEMSRKVLAAIEDFFRFRIGRPEILNRIGDNIIIFDFIRPEVSDRIFQKMLVSIVHKLSDTYNITLKLEKGMVNTLRTICCSDLSMGGRGIGNKLESAFINPLSRLLFEERVEQNGEVILTDISGNGDTWTLKARKTSS